MNLTKEQFNSKLNFIVQKSIEFDSIYNNLSEISEEIDPMLPELHVTSEQCLTAMTDDLVSILIPGHHNCYVDFINSCLVYYVWAIDEDTNSLDYDFYINLIEDSFQSNNDLPENFNNWMLYKAATGACRPDDFYNLFSIAESYN